MDCNRECSGCSNLCDWFYETYILTEEDTKEERED